MGFKSHSYLICSVPADHYSGRKISLPLLLPPGAAEEGSFQPNSTAPKATRRNDRASSSSVEGTASASLEKSTSGTSQGSSGRAVILLTL